MREQPSPENASKTISVHIPADGVTLEGDLTLPQKAKGLIVFVHGGGSSKHSARDGYIARILQTAGLATLLIDLLSAKEAARRESKTGVHSDVELQGRRLAAATGWLKQASPAENLPIGYFAEGTGASAALIGAARFTGTISAIVCRSGRLDLAGMALHKVLGPILLIVPENEASMVAFNRRAYYAIPSEKKLEIVPNASRLFEEPGTLDKVAQLARHWFETNFANPDHKMEAA